MPFHNKLKLHEAIVFSTRAHHGQVRKGSDVPFMIHPFETAQILTEAGCSDEVVIAGLLHDTLEDTETSSTDISSAFGYKVLGLVFAASEDKRQEWEVRKQHTIDYLKHEATQDEMLLICADKLSNLRAIRYEKDLMGEVAWARFKRGKDMQKWYYEGILNTLDPIKHYAMYAEYKWLMEELF